MHQDEDKPPAPPLRLTSASNNAHKGISLPVEMRPLPKEPPEADHKKNYYGKSKLKKEKSEKGSSFGEKPNIRYGRWHSPKIV